MALPSTRRTDIAAGAVRKAWIIADQCRAASAGETSGRERGRDDRPSLGPLRQFSDKLTSECSTKRAVYREMIRTLFSGGRAPPFIYGSGLFAWPLAVEIVLVLAWRSARRDRD